MKNILILLSFLAWGMTIHAKPRTWEELKQNAYEVLDSVEHSTGKRTKAPVKVLDQREGVAIIGRSSGGFAVMAIDDHFPAVMGYSQTSFDPETDNVNFMWWLNAVEQMTKVALASPLKSIRPNADKYPEEMLPFMKTEWGQSAPFNNMAYTASLMRRFTTSWRKSGESELK